MRPTYRIVIEGVFDLALFEADRQHRMTASSDPATHLVFKMADALVDMTELMTVAVTATVGTRTAGPVAVNATSDPPDKE